MSKKEIIGGAAIAVGAAALAVWGFSRRKARREQELTEYRKEVEQELNEYRKELEQAVNAGFLGQVTDKF